VLASTLVPLTFKGIFPPTIVSYTSAFAGDIIHVTHNNGAPIRWLVIERDEAQMTLFAIDNVARLPFDSENNSSWTESDIRNWLNNDFVEEFGFPSPYSIIPTEREVILSFSNRHLATAGDRDFYAFHIPRYAFRGADRAYRMPVIDYVRLPGPDTMLAIMDIGSQHYIRGDFWTEIPRFLDDQMPRFVTVDGHISMRDAKEIGGVRPVITITR